MTLLQRTIYGVCTKYLPSIHLVSIQFTRSRKGAKRQRRKEEKKKRSKEAKMQRSKEAKKKNNNNYQLPNPIINFYAEPQRRKESTQQSKKFEPPAFSLWPLDYHRSPSNYHLSNYLPTFPILSQIFNSCTNFGLM